MSHPIGIDLGTTHSTIAGWIAKGKAGFSGVASYNLNKQGSHELASTVFIEDDEGNPNIIVGKMAKIQGSLYPDQLVRAVKRQMDDANYRYEILGRNYSPMDVSAEILKELLMEVERQEGPGVFVPKGIVVTVPYYFKQHQNLNTQQAALQAIQDVYANRLNGRAPEELFLGLLAEPIAVGLDHAFNRLQSGRELALVFDLGGGTFDLTVFSLEQQNKRLKFEVLAVDGDDRLGGEDFDESFFHWACGEANIDLSIVDEKTKRKALKKIHQSITEAKHQLSISKSTEIIVPQAIGTQNISLDPVKRSHFEECISGKAGLNVNYFEEINYKLDTVLEKANVSEREIDTILLAGGSSQIPLFHKLLEDRFGSGKIKDAKDIRLAVSRGAAIYAAYKLDQIPVNAAERFLTHWEEIEIGEVNPHQLGLEINSRFEMFLRDNTLTPCKRTITFEPTVLSEDGQRAILEKIKVAQGAPSDFAIVGEITIDDIYTHGRALDDIAVQITFIADPTIVKVKVFIKGGLADGNDYTHEADLALQ